MNKAVVYLGPQGSGKSTAARAFAATFGKYREVSRMAVLLQPFGLASVLTGNVKALIIDELPVTPGERAGALSMMMNALIEVEQRGCPKRLEHSPQLIFCTCNERLAAELPERRYTIRRLA